MQDPKWEAVKTKCEEDIAKSHVALEAQNMTERDADFERGKIAYARDILALGQVKPVMPDTSYT